MRKWDEGRKSARVDGSRSAPPGPPRLDCPSLSVSARICEFAMDKVCVRKSRTCAHPSNGNRSALRSLEPVWWQPHLLSRTISVRVERVPHRCAAFARAAAPASGHAAVTLSSSVMNERRFMSSTADFRLLALVPKFDRELPVCFDLLPYTQRDHWSIRTIRKWMGGNIGTIREPCSVAPRLNSRRGGMRRPICSPLSVVLLRGRALRATSEFSISGYGFIH